MKGIRFSVFTLAVLLLVQGCARRLEPASAKTSILVSPSAEAEDARKRGDWKTVRTLYERLIQNEPDNDEYWYWLGIALLNTDQPTQAQEALARSIGLKDTPKAQYNLAIAFENTEDNAKAIEHLQRAIALNPDYALAWQRLALAQTQVGKWAEAGEAALRAKELRPNDLSINELIGGINRMQLTSRWPIEALERFNAGREAARKGDLSAAMQEYRSALERSPNFAECRAKMADALRRLGQVEQSEAEYRSAIADYQKIEVLELADSENNLANLLVEKSAKTEEAEKLVRQAISIRGERPTYLDTLARACDLRQQVNCAREAYAKLLQNPTGVSKTILDHAAKRLAELH